jgi:hypothetical protein
MTPEAERLFHQLANLGVEARCAVLDGPQIAAADRREVEELLAYDAPGTDLALGKDTPITRPVAPPSAGRIVATPEVGGLHHRYDRVAA